MSHKKIDFSKIEWESARPGIRSKSFEQNGKEIRLIELDRDLEHPDWCLTGHVGYVIEGELEIEFDGEILNFSKGDALFITAGEKDKHIPKALSKKVSLVLVEEILQSLD